MVGKVIRDYMAGGGRKLTVPGFGTFMRREGGEVIFVDLLKSDDGMLGEMVEDCGGFSGVEAMALIDRFIFETKTAIERGGSAVIEGFGVITLDHNGLYRFNHSPKKQPVRETAMQERLFETEAEAAPRHRPFEADGNPLRAGADKVESRRRTTREDKGPANRSDIFMIVAIVAAVIALAALVFGFSTGNMPFLK